MWWATPLEPDDRLLALLDPAERTRFAGYRQPADQRRFLTGRVLARTMAGRRLGVSPAGVALDATCPDCGKPHGRPQVVGANITLSISHAGERVGLALTDGVPVGLDVEAISRRSDDRLIAYALSEAERAVVDALPPDARADAFFGYWTRKEALMKATGRGLKLPLRSLTLSGPGEPPRLLAATDDGLDPARTRLADLDPGSGYLAAVAALTDRPLKVTESWWSP